MERFAAIVQLRQGRKRVTYPSFSLLLSCSLSGDSDWLNPTGHHGRGMQSLEVRDRVQVRASHTGNGWGGTATRIITVFFLGNAFSVFLLELS